MSPDSDVVQWITVAATLIQTGAAVVQVQQGQKAGEPTSPAAAVGSPLKLGLLASVFSLLWVAGFNHVYERRETEAFAGLYYTVRDGLQDASFLQVLLFLGDLVIPGLGCAATVAITRAIVVGHLDLSQTLVYIAALAASAVGLFVVVAQIYAFRSDVLLVPIVIGVIAGFQVDTSGPIKRPGGPS